MILTMIAGIISVVGGIGLLWFSKQFQRLSKSTSRSWGKLDQVVMQYRMSVGLCLLGSGVFCLASALYVWLRLR